MTRSTKGRRTHDKTLSIAPALPPEPRGWCERTARSDGGTWFDVTLHTSSPFEHDDPQVTIQIERRHPHLFGESARSDGNDYIEDWRASDLDSLVEMLQEVIATARRHGMIPPSDGLQGWQTTAKKFAVAEAGAMSTAPPPRPGA